MEPTSDGLRDKIANELDAISPDAEWTPGFRAGFLHGLKVAACIVRDNHPKEDDE